MVNTHQEVDSGKYNTYRVIDSGDNTHYTDRQLILETILTRDRVVASAENTYRVIDSGDNTYRAVDCADNTHRVVDSGDDVLRPHGGGESGERSSGCWFEVGRTVDTRHGIDAHPLPTTRHNDVIVFIF